MQLSKLKPMTNAPLDGEEIIFHVLNGLGLKYKEISTVIHVCNSPISFEELHNKLSDYDATSITVNFANKTNSSKKGKIHN